MAAILSTQLEFGAGVVLCAVTGEQFVDLLLPMSAHRIYAINCCELIAPQSSGLFREQGEVWDGTDFVGSIISAHFFYKQGLILMLWTLWTMRYCA